MNVFVWAYLGGLVGALLMDITEAYAARSGVTSGVSAELIGRWVMGLSHGKIGHTEIQLSWPGRGEAQVGRAFHFLVGGGGVALIYPAFCQLLAIQVSAQPWMGGLLFGLITTVLPWFVLLPLFGWGVFGSRGPRGSNALLASTLSHIPYGLGVGVMTALSNQTV